MNSTARKNIAKHIVLVFLFLILYILQSVPHLFEISGVTPYLTVSAAVAVAMFEGEFAGGIYGAVAGLLCDINGIMPFGFNGFIISVCCVSSGLLIIYLMRCNIFTFVLFEVFALMLRGCVEYFFAFGMWDYPDAPLVFFSRTLPVVIYSAAAGIPLFFLVRFLHWKFPVSEGDDT